MSLVSVDRLTIDDIYKLFSLTDNKRVVKLNKRIANVFFQPSLRTRTSFELAADLVGCKSTNIFEKESALDKGETIYDTLLTLSLSHDIIVLRSGEDCTNFTNFNIINAGDCKEHPTQALIDLYTILKHVYNPHVLIVGDIVHARTATSLIKLLHKFNIPFRLFFTQDLTDPRKGELFRSYYLDAVKTNTGIKASWGYNNYNIIYLLRNQVENHSGFDSSIDYVNFNSIMSLVKKDTMVMHPFPRGRELSQVFDSDHRALYIKQMKYAVPVRAAILESLLNE